MKRKARAPTPHATLEIDPRIELIAILECLANGNSCPGGERSGYLERAVKALPRSHPAAKCFERMTPSDWRHRHPSLILLDFGLPPRLEVDAFPEHYSGLGRGDALAEFLPLLRDFASRGFMEFFAAEKDAHERCLEQVRGPFAALDYLTPWREYFGLESGHRYHFLLSPLYHGGADHNVMYRREGGLHEIYSIIGHERVEGGLARFSFSIPSMAAIAWHEVSHTVVDSITQEFKERLEALSPLYALMTGRARSQYRGPQGWLHIVDENVIRALTSRLAGSVFGEAAGREALERERAQGFALAGAVFEALGEYERGRVRYPSIRDFYPRIVRTLENIKERLPGRGRR